MTINSSPPANYEHPKDTNRASPATLIEVHAVGSREASTSFPGIALPVGWEQSTTPAGRPYFINHNNHTTTWIDPRTSRAVTDNATGSVSLAGSPLPTGWEARRAQNGRTYFIDHVERKTTWDDPRYSSNIEISNEK
ncbi:hypothetical protein BP5796_06540 [Coleophoma crateriformis]|uniref:WW domain-containing protein n=1 Tax=Coleophoma crateriformis TaxID=565419 RepID=A0A3D8RNU3_9HELO|nr:hypothetical protein BP5796_06540 [Coleophoma crateriformis]